MILTMIHLILALAMLLAAIAVFFKWRSDKFDRQSPVKYFFWFFAFFAVAHFSLSLPLILTGDPEAMRWGYDLSIFFVFVMIAIFSRIWVYFSGFSMKKTMHAPFAIMAVGLVVLLIEARYSGLPSIDGNMVVWNAAPAASLLIVSLAFMSSFALSYSLIRNLMKGIDPTSRLKLFLINLSVISIGISGLYFIASGWTAIITALSFNFLGAISAASAFMMKEEKAKT